MEHLVGCSTSGNRLTLWKIAIWMSKNCKTLVIIYKQIAKIFLFFQKIVNGNFFGKKDTFWTFFENNVKFFVIFWHSNGNFPEGRVWYSTSGDRLTKMLGLTPKWVKSAPNGTNLELFPFGANLTNYDIAGLTHTLICISWIFNLFVCI